MLNENEMQEIQEAAAKGKDTLAPASPPKTSHIFGVGYGSSHDWREVSQGSGYTGYKCAACGASFNHLYDKVPNIFHAIEDFDVPNVCEALS